MALTKVTKELIQGSLSVDWQSAVKTSSFQSITGQGYFVNTTASAVTVTMPATANVGDIVSIVDYAGTAQTNNITITAALNINGSSNDVKIDYERGAVSIIYSGTIQGWVAEFAANDGTDALVTIPLTVDYLVIAGGGSGGSNEGGGGGAGGLRTSYGNSGGGGSSETQLTLATGTNYTVTIGAGGTVSTPTPYYPGGDGSNSVFSTITSTGGGGGGTGISGLSPAFEPGRDGGSGGGGSRYGNLAAPGGSGTTNQGFNGGTSGVNQGDSTGGGGGAGAVGQSATGAGGFDGGIGITNAITVASGTGPYYAGGGGGGSYSNIRVGAGGQGGGGTGVNTGPSSTSNNGTANTGGGAGGGGGSGSDSIRGGAVGGSGVVILRYPNSYTITNPGSGLTFTTATVGTDKVTTFTAGTGNIQFN